MGSSSAPAALSVPIVAPEQLDQLPFGDRMREALKLVLDGDSYREAAEAVGLQSHQDLWRAARRLGIGTSSCRVLDGHRRIARLANDELERRLVHDVDGISTKDLAVIGGIASDKLAKAEAWGRDANSSGNQTGLDRILEALAATGGGRVELSVEPAVPAIELAPTGHE